MVRDLKITIRLCKKIPMQGEQSMRNETYFKHMLQ